MDELEFDRLVLESPVSARLLLDPQDKRVQVGRLLAILQFYLPQDLSYQEHRPLFPPPFYSSSARYHLKVYTWSWWRCLENPDDAGASRR